MKKYLQQSVLQHGALLLVLLAMIGVFSWQSENFLQQSTFVSIANQIPDLIFVTVGMTLVLIIGGIDLSVGSVLALSSAVVGVLMVDQGWSLWTALPVSLLSGAACGLANGWICRGFGIPSFIVTLGMLEIARGATQVVTENRARYIGSSIQVLGEPVAGMLLSPAFLVALVSVFVAQFVLSRTVFGRYCVAIGTNEETVRLSGIRAKPYAICVFAISGLLAGLAGISRAAQLSTASPNAGIGIELEAIAACVIGGTSLSGGRGNVISSFIGVLIIAVLRSGLAQLGVSEAGKQVITGLVIIFAVILDAVRNRWSSRPATS
jgi:ribose transport system permease protein